MGFVLFCFVFWWEWAYVHDTIFKEENRKIKNLRLVWATQ
jgi:hypothetical protein